MRRQRNMVQMKEQINPAPHPQRKTLNKMDINNPSDAEFKTLAIRTLQELREDLNSIKKDLVRYEGYTN